eukprot:UN1769
MVTWRAWHRSGRWSTSTSVSPTPLVTPRSSRGCRTSTRATSAARKSPKVGSAWRGRPRWKTRTPCAEPRGLRHTAVFAVSGGGGAIQLVGT